MIKEKKKNYSCFKNFGCLLAKYASAGIILSSMLWRCETLHTARQFEIAEMDKYMDSEDHRTCVNRGVNPDVLDNETSRMYWECRAYITNERKSPGEGVNLSDVNYNNKVDILIDQHIKRAVTARQAYLKEGQSEQSLEQSDHGECLRKGFTLGMPSDPRTAAYYRCRIDMIKDRITVVPDILTRRDIVNKSDSELLKKVLSPEDKIYNASALHEPVSIKELMRSRRKCETVAFNRDAYNRCLDENFTVRLCYNEVITRITKKEYEDIKSCYSIVHLQMGDELSQGGEKMVKFVDEDGNIKSGRLFKKPEFTQTELVLRRQESFFECQETRAEERRAEEMEMRTKCSSILESNPDFNMVADGSEPIQNYADSDYTQRVTQKIVKSSQVGDSSNWWKYNDKTSRTKNSKGRKLAKSIVSRYSETELRENLPNPDSVAGTLSGSSGMEYKKLKRQYSSGKKNLYATPVATATTRNMATQQPNGYYLKNLSRR